MTLEAGFLTFGGVVCVFLARAVFLAVVSLLPDRRRARSDRVSVAEAIETRRYTIVVPAHDEEAGIGATLASLATLDYDDALVHVVVVADHCTDGTVDVARAAGVECLERRGGESTGKGRALAFAFEELVPRGDADAFVVVDADTLVEPHLLRAFDRRLSAGASVVQAYYDVLAPERSPTASFTYAGFAVSRNLNYRGRSRLGWGANLVGNGMCFASAVLERFGWRAHTISEDLEHQLELFLAGVRVEFCHEARVFGDVPGRVAAFHAQRSRWDVGKYKLRNRYVPRLFVRAMRERDLGAFDTAAELVSPPYAILGGLVLGSSLLYLVLGPARVTGTHVFLGGMSLVFLAYVFAGLRAAGAPGRVYLNLAYAPVFVLWRVVIALTSPFRSADVWRPSRRG